MALTEKDIKKIARLARVYLTSHEEEVILPELNHIFTLLQEIDAIDESVNLASIASYAHNHAHRQFLRPDEVTAKDHRELYQSVAPAVKDGFYLVPKVIE